MPSFAPYLAEALGTFALVFAGPGAAAVDAESGGSVGGVGIGMSFGLIVMAMIFAVGHVSGCHINPAITIAFRALGRISTVRAFGYVVAQLAGAVLAGLAIIAIVGDAGDAGASVPRINGADAALWSEIILTFFLAVVVFAVATDERAQGPFAAIAVGGYVGFAATGWGAIANASMNPARSFGPAVASNTWDSHWVYWAGPIAGALLAAVVYEVLREPKLPDAPGAGGQLRTNVVAGGSVEPRVRAAPTVLYVCVHNAGRSQMAAAFTAKLGGDALRVLSAGSEPADQLNPQVVAAMAEAGIDITGERPKLLTDDAVWEADAVVTMGCGDACPFYPGKRYLDWELDDPAGQPLETVRRIRDEIRVRVVVLLRELGIQPIE